MQKGSSRPRKGPPVAISTIKYPSSSSLNQHILSSLQKFLRQNTIRLLSRSVYVEQLLGVKGETRRYIGTIDSQ